MPQVYDPLSHRTVVARPGEASFKFYAVNKLVVDLDAAGFIRMVASDLAPSDITVIWLDIADPEIEGGVPKAWDTVAWAPLTPELFAAHIGATGGGGGGGGSWGSITGTLSNQADLQAALNAIQFAADIARQTAVVALQRSRRNDLQVALRAQVFN